MSRSVGQRRVTTSSWLAGTFLPFFIERRFCPAGTISAFISALNVSRMHLCSSNHSSHSPEDIAAKVKFERADAYAPETYAEHLKGARAVIVAIGGPPVPNFFYKGGKAVG